MTLMRVLIKDRTALPRAFSHINRRAFRVYSDDVSEDDNKVSEDQIRLHFRNWCEARNRGCASPEVTDPEFKIFKKAYVEFAKDQGNADPNISDVYHSVDLILLPVGIPGALYGGKKGDFTDQTS